MVEGKTIGLLHCLSILVDLQGNFLISSPAAPADWAAVSVAALTTMVPEAAIWLNQPDRFQCRRYRPEGAEGSWLQFQNQPPSPKVPEPTAVTRTKVPPVAVMAVELGGLADAYRVGTCAASSGNIPGDCRVSRYTSARNDLTGDERLRRCRQHQGCGVRGGDSGAGYRRRNRNSISARTGSAQLIDDELFLRTTTPVPEMIHPGASAPVPTAETIEIAPASSWGN